MAATAVSSGAKLFSAEEVDASINVRVVEIGKNGLGGSVNSLGMKVRRQLRDDLLEAIEDSCVDGIVLMGHTGAIMSNKSKHFSAGADIREFGKSSPKGGDEFDGPVLSNTYNGKYTHESYTNSRPSIVDVCYVVCHSYKPIVAAIHGACLGGGLEVALACDYRICSSKSSNLGLPECQIGLIPGAGGTQRLPRLIGVGPSLQMITSGKSLTAFQALTMKLVDDVVLNDADLVSKAMQWTKFAISLGADFINSQRKIHLRPVPGSKVENVKLCQMYQKKKLPSKAKGGLAVHAAVEAIQASVETSNFEEGLQVEEELFWNLLLQSVQGRALRHAFFAQRSVQAPWTAGALTQAAPGASLSLKEIQTIGIVGAGTMGQGIAGSCLQAGYAVVLVDVNPQGLQRGIKAVDAIMAKAAAKKAKQNKKFTTTPSIKHKLTSGTSLDVLESCHVVIEAVFEKLELKQNIFQQLDRIVKHPHALLLTNTSTLDVEQIMSRVTNKKRLPYTAGMHFFSPAHIMKLVELIYVPEQTAVQTIQLMQGMVKRLKKVGVVIANGPTIKTTILSSSATPILPSRMDGFVGNRMIFPYSSEAVLLLMENDGLAPKDVDGTFEKFGMPIGPLKMADLAGNDIGYYIRQSKGLVSKAVAGQLKRYPHLADLLVTKTKRLGQKVGKGWYTYEKSIGNGRFPLPSSDVQQMIDDYRESLLPTNIRHASKKSAPSTRQQILEQGLFPLVNEGFKILEEGVVDHPSQIDIVYLFGYGFPSWRGGPMFWADEEVGLANLLKSLQSFSKRYPSMDYFVPSKLLETCVARNVKVHEYFNKMKMASDSPPTTRNGTRSKL